MLIGYWRSANQPGWPDPHDFVDESWDPEERELVARFLDAGTSPPWSACGWSWCRICASDPECVDEHAGRTDRVRSAGEVNGIDERSDGVYLWPEGLSHYVREHSVRLPVVVIEHIRRWRPLAEPDEPIRFRDIDWDWWSSARPDWPRQE